jgi:hypothetical protein
VNVQKLLKEARKFSGEGGQTGAHWLDELAGYLGSVCGAHRPLTPEELAQLMGNPLHRTLVITQLLQGTASDLFQRSLHSSSMPWRDFAAWVTNTFPEPTLAALDQALQQLQWHGPYDGGASLRSFSASFQAAASALRGRLFTQEGLVSLYIKALRHPALEEFLSREQKKAARQDNLWDLQHAIREAHDEWDALPERLRQPQGSNSSSGGGGGRWQRWRRQPADSTQGGGAGAPGGSGQPGGVNAAVPGQWRPGCAVCGNPDHKVREVPACWAAWGKLSDTERQTRREQYGMGPKQGEGHGPNRGRR